MDPIMNPTSMSQAYDIGFADGQLVSLAVAEECIRLREANERMERDNARMADQLQRSRMLAEQAGAQEVRFDLAFPVPAKRGERALGWLLICAAAMVAVAGWWFQR